MIRGTDSGNFGTAYRNMLKEVLSYGDVVTPRDMQTRELAPYISVVNSTDSRFLYIRERHLNYAFGIMEAVQILSGYTDLKELMIYNSKMAKFADEDVLRGAYGPRLRHARTRSRLKDELHNAKYNYNWEVGGALRRDEDPWTVDQLRAVILKLRADKESRQAVATIWDPGVDSIAAAKDIPCNVLLMFSIRNHNLNMTVTRRSSDLVLGVPYDHLCFTMIQDVVANSLGVKPGEIVEFANSLHIYMSLYPTELGNIQKALSHATGEINPGWSIDKMGRTNLDLTGWDRFISEYKKYMIAERNSTLQPTVIESFDAFYNHFSKIDEWMAKAMLVVYVYKTIRERADDSALWSAVDNMFSLYLKEGWALVLGQTIYKICENVSKISSNKNAGAAKKTLETIDEVFAE